MLIMLFPLPHSHVYLHFTPRVFSPANAHGNSTF